MIWGVGTRQLLREIDLHLRIGVLVVLLVMPQWEQ